jgi:hypothetical protein
MCLDELTLIRVMKIGEGSALITLSIAEDHYLIFHCPAI